MDNVLKSTVEFFFPNERANDLKTKGKDLDTLNYFAIPKLTYLGNIYI